jgi:hypothetical protein
MKDQNDQKSGKQSDANQLSGKKSPRYQWYIVQYDVGQRGILFHIRHYTIKVI